ncbi:hypothetical protein CL617_04555 [archaeon]|nr:hypothetical protein [archaeon]|tara:strand:+ start:11774 stop:11971 length:198 start_codon:yes stop_codon:yes gene_type:complete
MVNVANNLFKIIVGIILLIIVGWIGIVASSWGRAVIELVKGGLLISVILIGLLMIFVGLSDMRSE